MSQNPEISVVVPFFNEEGTIAELHQRLVNVLNTLGKPYEVIFVDDGSRDDTFEKMRHLTPLRAFRLAYNVGHTKAFAFGVSQARGSVLVGLDGDLENLPEDIPKLLTKFEEGHDLVVGWRKDRWQGQYLTRKLPSLLANRFISVVSGLPIHDHGCFLRVYRKDILSKFDFHGDSQRMIVPYAYHNRAKVAEVEVGYQPRKYGESKFGLWRIFDVLFDTLTFHFFHKFGDRPRHFFGWFGLISFGVATLAFLWMVYLKLAEGISFIITPLPTVVAMFTLMGMQFVLMGLLAEIFVRHRNKERQLLVGTREEIHNI
jgi:glycosyltransferase involved in cell wall biosynthesis